MGGGTGTYDHGLHLRIIEDPSWIAVGAGQAELRSTLPGAFLEQVGDRYQPRPLDPMGQVRGVQPADAAGSDYSNIHSLLHLFFSQHLWKRPYSL
jgi:hypothetical protein